MPTPRPRFRPWPLPLPGLEPAAPPAAGPWHHGPGTSGDAGRDAGTRHDGPNPPPLAGRTAPRDQQPSPLAGAPSAVEIPPPAVLRRWADDLALTHFGESFSGTVAWAARLRYRAGDFTPSTGRIRLSLPYFTRYGPGEARGILLHELCHWWLYRHGLIHREDAPAFQALLRTVGAPAKARPMPRPARPRPYLYACPRCGARYRYSRRVDYACGRCCRALARGRYDARFRLRLISAPGGATARRRTAQAAAPRDRSSGQWGCPARESGGRSVGAGGWLCEELPLR